MRRLRLAILFVLATLAVPATAAADGLILAANVGESYVWLSPWSQGEPLTEMGLRFYTVDDELDLGVGLTMGRPFGGDLVDAGKVTADFTLRFHDDMYGDDDTFEPFLMFSVQYSHWWAQDQAGVPGPPALPASWDTRNGVGLRLGGGFLVTADEFYFDLTAYGVTELLWPEPAFVAGGGVAFAMGVYIG
jgi:hypothetical protein